VNRKIDSTRNVLGFDYMLEDV